MVPEKLLDDVLSLDEECKFALLRALIDDLSLGEHGYEIFGFRGNSNVAKKLMEELESINTSAEPEIE